MRTVVADPSRTVLKIVTRLLEEGSHEVRPFEDGKKALDYIQSNSEVRALITSAELPSLSGIELCGHARRLASTHRPLYILLMSSSSDQRYLVKALDNGADDFICKPPVAEELFARLRAAERLTSMQAELIQLAMTNSLTGVRTRRAFFERAADAAARADAGGALSAVMFDIDHFKRINDEHGHETGDSVIRAVAQAAAKVSDNVGRLGGEEFALLIDGSLQDAAELADNLRRIISWTEFDDGTAGFYGDLQLRRQRMDAGRHHRAASQARRCGALRRQGRRPQPRRDRQGVAARGQAIARSLGPSVNRSRSTSAAGRGLLNK